MPVLVCLQAAQSLNKEDSWHRLAVEALRQGNHEIVEMAYQQTKNYDRLSFLYLITGNTTKLKMMLKISQVRGDVMSRFHNALYLGDVEERVKILESAGQSTPPCPCVRVCVMPLSLLRVCVCICVLPLVPIAQGSVGDCV